MSTAFITGNPPTLQQIKTGAGTLQGITVPQPVGSVGGAAALDVSFYDSATNAPLVLTGNPIASVKTANGFANFPLNASFTNGLVAVLRSTSTVQVTYA
ncbi:hypothetical protein [Trinickia mobilis]|uniref:hypothetical protein n=1 Tax=Trinickia mobilis TaxID=2816356 RepID=UPI001A8F3A02|nr:hypothetical protein [Trinickia mobilis]